jgi:hypothetical protein
MFQPSNASTLIEEERVENLGAETYYGVNDGDVVLSCERQGCGVTFHLKNSTSPSSYSSSPFPPASAPPWQDRSGMGQGRQLRRALRRRWTPFSAEAQLRPVTNAPGDFNSPLSSNPRFAPKIKYFSNFRFRVNIKCIHGNMRCIFAAFI